MKAVVVTFNQERALVVGAFSVIVRPMDRMEHHSLGLNSPRQQ